MASGHKLRVQLSHLSADCELLSDPGVSIMDAVTGWPWDDVSLGSDVSLGNEVSLGSDVSSGE